MNRKQYGKFSIPIITFSENLDGIANFMRGMVIVKAEFVFGSFLIEYHAIAPYFKEIEGDTMEPRSYFFTYGNGEYYLLDEEGNEV